MNRCLDCNSSLTKDETTCYTCGTPVQGESARAVFGQHFATFLKIAFFVSLGITAVSLFTSFMPSFAKCATASVVLMFAKSSADQMLEKKKG
jgi:hypothetical protein